MIIGLDGATLDLIRPWAAAGVLPTFRRLMENGTWGTLRTIIPPMTPTAWSSFLTGMNPGKHGLFDFTIRKEDEYDTYLVNAGYRDGPSLWRLLSQAGRRVTVFNVPITYPPEQVNGPMVSGLLTPAGATDATWPPELQRELEQAIPDFNFSPPGMHSRGQELEFVRAVRALNRTTLQATRYLMERQPWDFLISVFMGVDVMSHFMWRHMETGGASAPEPLRGVLASAIQDCYRDMDDVLAELMQAVGDDTHVIIMSDHGFGGMDSYMSVNAWLVGRGYLRFKRNPLSQLRYIMYRLGITPLSVYGLLLALRMGNMMRQTSRRNIGLVQKIVKTAFLSLEDVDWSHTQAYSIGYGGPIFVNLRGREPQGIVEPGAEYEALIDELIADLRSLQEPGMGLPFVGEIHRGRSIYSGPHVDRAPDLVFLPRDPKHAGLGLAEFPSNRWLASSPDRSGFHRMEGILFVSGPGIRRGRELRGASIMDIAPTVLALMGVPIPEAMDGRVLEAAMTHDLRQQLSVTYSREEYGGPEQLASPEISAEDEEALRSRLRGLGYVA
jgi:predicted AlkP superfamily phosphohydrolase/phosphomutase